MARCASDHQPTFAIEAGLERHGGAQVVA
jgi:hypothetical protein